MTGIRTRDGRVMSSKPISYTGDRRATHLRVAFRSPIVEDPVHMKWSDGDCIRKVRPVKRINSNSEFGLPARRNLSSTLTFSGSGPLWLDLASVIVKILGQERHIENCRRIRPTYVIAGLNMRQEPDGLSAFAPKSGQSSPELARFRPSGAVNPTNSALCRVREVTRRGTETPFPAWTRLDRTQLLWYNLVYS